MDGPAPSLSAKARLVMPMLTMPRFLASSAESMHMELMP